MNTNRNNNQSRNKTKKSNSNEDANFVAFSKEKKPKFHDVGRGKKKLSHRQRAKSKQF